jgi:hypothetical protein
VVSAVVSGQWIVVSLHHLRESHQPASTGNLFRGGAVRTALYNAALSTP